MSSCLYSASRRGFFDLVYCPSQPSSNLIIKFPSKGNSSSNNSMISIIYVIIQNNKLSTTISMLYFPSPSFVGRAPNGYAPPFFCLNLILYWKRTSLSIIPASIPVSKPSSQAKWKNHLPLSASVQCFFSSAVQCLILKCFSFILYVWPTATNLSC